jgi:hypothetical protein
MIVPLVDHEARDQQGHRDPDAAVADDIFLVLFEESDGETDFLGELVGL